MVGGKESGFDARLLERVAADRTDAVQLPGLEQRIPQCLGFAGIDPQLVAQVTGKPGTRHHQLGTFEVAVHQAEGFQRVETRQPQFAEHAERRRSLHGERRHVLSFVGDRHIQADCGGLQPGKMALLRTQPVLAFAQVEDRAVVDDLALVVAPDRVGDAPGPDLCHVASDQAIDVVERVRSGDAVFRHRRQVEDSRRVANRKVLGVRTVEFVWRRVALPLVPLFDRIERREP